MTVQSVKSRLCSLYLRKDFVQLVSCLFLSSPRARGPVKVAVGSQLLKSTAGRLKLSKKVFHNFTVALKSKNLSSKSQVLSALSQYLRTVSKPGGMVCSNNYQGDCLSPNIHNSQHVLIPWPIVFSGEDNST